MNSLFIICAFICGYMAMRELIAGSDSVIIPIGVLIVFIAAVKHSMRGGYLLAEYVRKHYIRKIRLPLAIAYTLSTAVSAPVFISYMYISNSMIAGRILPFYDALTMWEGWILIPFMVFHILLITAFIEGEATTRERLQEHEQMRMREDRGGDENSKL